MSGSGYQDGLPAGNIAQIDTPYLTETTTGLTYVVNRFQGWSYSGHITPVARRAVTSGRLRL